MTKEKKEDSWGWLDALSSVRSRKRPLESASAEVHFNLPIRLSPVSRALLRAHDRLENDVRAECEITGPEGLRALHAAEMYASSALSASFRRKVPAIASVDSTVATSQSKIGTHSNPGMVNIASLPEKRQKRESDVFFEEAMDRLIKSCTCVREDLAVLQKLVQVGKKRLKSYQKDGVARILSRANKNTLLYDEMGLGKSLQSLFVAAIQCLAEQAWPVLIVSPASLRLSWLEEIEKWLPFIDINEVAIIKNKRSVIPSGVKFIICSYRMLEDMATEIVAFESRIVIADEVHKTRSHESQQSKALARVCGASSQSILMTGTPMLIRPFELFTQLEIALSQEDKNTLLPGWGWSSDSSGLKPQSSLNVNRSPLFQLLNKPLTHFQDLARLCGSKLEAWVFDAAATLQGVKKGPELKRAFQRINLSAQRFILSTLCFFPSELAFFIREGMLSKKDKHFDGVLKLMTNKASLERQGRKDINFLLGFYSEFQNKLFAEDHCFSVVLANIWDGHRFGVYFCNGKNNRMTRFHRKRWEYAGINQLRITSLRNIINSYMIRRQKNDVLDDLPPKRRKLHLIPNLVDKTAQNSAIVQSSSEIAENAGARGAENALMTLARLSGLRKDQLAWELHCIGIAKAEYVVDHLIEELTDMHISERIIVFVRHLAVLEQIQRKLLVKRGENPAAPSYKAFHFESLSGSVPISERDRIVQQFQTSEMDGPRLLLLSIEAMSVGITLTRSSKVYMAELHWSPQILKQAEDRAHRIGQRDSVCVEYIIASGTIEELVWPMLQRRFQRMESTISTLRNHFDFHFDDYDEALCQNRTQGKDNALLPPPKDPSEGSSQSSIRLALSCNAENLAFRVSETIRIHIYRMLEDGSYQPLHENFAMSDLRFICDETLEDLKQKGERETSIEAQTNKWLLARLPARLRDLSSDSFLQAQAFVEEWLDLSVTTQNKLLKLMEPLRVPLESMMTHAKDSALKIENVLSFDRDATPAVQMHRAAIYSVGPGSYGIGFVKYRGGALQDGKGTATMTYSSQQQAFDLRTGRPLCLYCGAICKEAPHHFQEELSAREGQVQHVKIELTIRALFCSDSAPCYNSWHIKCNKKSARLELSEADMGVCAKCKVDTRKMFHRARVFPPEDPNRKAALFCTSEEAPGEECILCPHVVKRSQNSSEEARLHWSELQRQALGSNLEDTFCRKVKLTEGMFWEADHILAVKLGGGEAPLDNYQTLCKPCHLLKTKEDVAKIAQLRRAQAKHSQQHRHFRIGKGSKTASTAQKSNNEAKSNSSKDTCPRCGHPTPTARIRICHDLVCDYDAFV